MIGAGRALPHKGLSALQPWNTSKASKSAPRGRETAPIRFIRHRTPITAEEWKWPSTKSYSSLFSALGVHGVVSVMAGFRKFAYVAGTHGVISKTVPQP
jgi:hypothetical protein